jgi:glutamine amidotransferase
MISILSYGCGNISSIANMLRALGVDTQIVETPSQVLQADKLILPGVGAFDYGMSQLNKTGLCDALSEVALQKKIPILGICLGMQLMCLTSEEGERCGLGWIDAKVSRFLFPPEERQLKVPHMGWNTLKIARETPVVVQEDERQRYYFVHSYYVSCKERSDVIATSHHGHEFVAAFNRNNLYGVQFHPEKSHRYGLSLMKRFADL